KLIALGRVRLNGQIVTELGTRADPHKDVIEVDGRRMVAERPVYVLLHKPRGVVSTRYDPQGRPTVVELVQSLQANLYPVGRLDFHTSGALLLTNDGDFTQGLLHPKKKVPKDYVVKVQGEMSDKDLERWRQGVKLDDGAVTAPCEVFLLRRERGKTWIKITLQEGRNQQIRRMGNATGFPVMRLVRLSFAGITTEGLRPGQFRLLTVDELRNLKANYGVPRRIPRGEPLHSPPTSLARRPVTSRVAWAGKAPSARPQKSSAAVPSAKSQADNGTRSRPSSRNKRPR
ncbi:MAG: pseudouridine synthase, partial [Myxococcales bacterium]|nr:pseudouridine synthase [Myxococcales bacterium]